MPLTEYLDKGASLGPDRPCLTMENRSMTYGEVQAYSYLVAGALERSGVLPGDKVAILSSNDSLAFATVFGISRAGAVWCPINPRNEAAENRELLALFDCVCLVFKSDYRDLVDRIAPDLPGLKTLVCLDADDGAIPSIERWTAAADMVERKPVDDVALLVGTGGTTGKPKGVMLTGRNIETMSAITLMSYPFGERPVYLALAPLTHAAGVLCFPVMATGGEIVVLPKPDLTEFLSAVERHHVTHTFLPPTLIYMLLAHENLATTDLSSLRCFWYGAAPISSARLADALVAIGPVMAQLFGQSEAPMMISTMSPSDHFCEDGSIARERLSSAGKPSPLVTVAAMDSKGHLLPPGERGEIVVRSSLVMAGYYKNPDATAEASQHGWHHTGDIGYLDEDNFLFIVDRAKDMIITGGFNVYSIEVEQALMEHPDVQDCGVIGVPDEKWGERIVAVLQPKAGVTLEPDEIITFVKKKIGSVKTPKDVYVWGDLPRSKLGKVLKNEIKAKVLS